MAARLNNYNMPPLTFTPLRISTLVTTGHLGSKISLVKLFDQMSSILIPIGYPEEGVLKMEHETKVIGHSARDMLTKRRVSDKTFFNQSTIVIRKKREDSDEMKEVNVKLFANGGFQMTGVTSEEFSRKVIEYMLSVFANLGETISETPLTLQKFAIQLLNSDYKINSLIKRAELHRILCQEYKLSSTLETTIYQGVNTKYYYNEEAKIKNGICMCPRFCNGQGDGKATGQCKKITIAAFQTGSIIITGARNRPQLDEAYGFMNTVLQTHSDTITKAAPVAS
jgi:TATA-box binding protein (TBP) (component of TFIID and TFIIIB)